MRNVIIFSLGLVIINFTGCATKDLDKKTQAHKVQVNSSKKVVKKESKKSLPQTKKEKNGLKN